MHAIEDQQKRIRKIDRDWNWKKWWRLL